ncbi:CurM [Halomicronema hongdechloris C2206]|uniref:CurM n=2 Tax=Halomicronema hongdechloris TaxID=1209493 RepID=A0A1Z3HH15_9CYAN|nr:CurM [Halomicronema hongdechloris C2206]
MLIRILDSHSKISAPCEIAFPKYFRRDWKRKTVNEKYKQICDYYSANFYLCKGNPQHLFQKIRRKEKKKSVVIKEPRQSLFLDKIYQDFADFKLIHLVRDARSVAMSPWFINNPKRGLEIWYRYNKSVLEVADNLKPSHKLIVRYEDLVEDTSTAIKKVVEFLGYAFEPKMLNYGKFKHADDEMLPR